MRVVLVLLLTVAACSLPPPAPDPPAPGAPDDVRVVVREDTTSPRVALALEADVGCAEPDRAALDLAWAWLAGPPAARSRLGEDVRVRVLGTLGAQSDAVDAERVRYTASVHVAGATVARTHFVVRLLRYRLHTLLRDGVPDDGLDAARAALRAAPGLCRGAAYAAAADTLGHAAVRRALSAHLGDGAGRLGPHRVWIRAPQAGAIRQALVAGPPARVRYAERLPGEVYVEDRAIGTFPLGLNADDVVVAR